MLCTFCLCTSTKICYRRLGLLLRNGPATFSTVHAVGLEKEEQEKVLQIFNSSSPEQLQQYKLPSKCLSQVLEYRNTHGTVPSMEILLSMGDMPAPELTKVCQRILQKHNAKKKGKLVVTTSLSREQLEGVQEIVSLELRLPNLSFARLTQDRQLLEWDTVPVFADNVPQHGLDYLHDAVQSFMKFIPPSNFYLLEQSNLWSKKNSGIQSQKILEAILFTLLRMSGKRVVSVTGSSLCRYFNLTVGNERISGEKVVNNLIQPSNGQGDTKLLISDALLENYRGREVSEREYMNGSLLLAFAFNEEVMHRNFQ